MDLDNWRTQIRKGYLEFCLLLLIRKHGRVYGLELLQQMESLQLPLKEGTLYPLLNRLTDDGFLRSVWDTESAKGHPRKFYSLTKRGETSLQEMSGEFTKLVDVVDALTPRRGTS
jgi:PadR family transcriptional regulator, regulatory protein PadR